MNVHCSSMYINEHNSRERKEIFLEHFNKFEISTSFRKANFIL